MPPRASLPLARLVSTAVFVSPGGLQPALASCLDSGGFAVFQCAGRACLSPPPDFTPGKYFVDRNYPVSGLQNISAAFCQIGFGNRTLNTGFGAAGTGSSGAPRPRHAPCP